MKSRATPAFSGLSPAAAFPGEKATGWLASHSSPCRVSRLLRGGMGDLDSPRSRPNSTLTPHSAASMAHCVSSRVEVAVFGATTPRKSPYLNSRLRRRSLMQSAMRRIVGRIEDAVKKLQRPITCRRFEDLVRRTGLDNRPTVHSTGLPGDLPRKAHLVFNEHHPQPLRREFLHRGKGV